MAALLPAADASPIELAACLSRWSLAAYADSASEVELRRDCEARGIAVTRWAAENTTGMLAVGQCRNADGSRDMVGVISVAGTDDVGDLRQNLDICPQSVGEFCSDNRVYLGCDPAMKAHTGFLVAALLARRQVTMLEPELPGSVDRLYLTGHSLGGAAATLMPLVWADCRFAQVVTFGAPRCLSRWAKSVRRYAAMGVKVLRVVHLSDLIPEVPRLKYHHPPGELLVIRYCGSMARRVRWHERLFRVGKWAVAAVTRDWKRLYDAHSMRNYARCLRAAVWSRGSR